MYNFTKSFIDDKLDELKIEEISCIMLKSIEDPNKIILLEFKKIINNDMIDTLKKVVKMIEDHNNFILDSFFEDIDLEDIKD